MFAATSIPRCAASGWRPADLPRAQSTVSPYAGLPSLYLALSPERAKQVVAVVQEHLKPYGLRSLAPGDPPYRGRYTGDGGSRDGAYHQGTVWPWLLGPFITAYMKVDGGSKAARTQAEGWLAPLKEHLSDGGLGHISEIFDGDAPHRPVGCIAQAWSLAEILRAAVEDVWGIRAQQSAMPLDVVAQQPSETNRK